MLDTNTASLDTASWATQFFIFFVGLVIYGRLKRKLATVVAVERHIALTEEGLAESTSEKEALLGAPATDISVEEPAQNRLPTPLIVWAVFMLAVNATVWYTTSIAWMTELVRTTALWQLIFMSLFTYSPMSAAVSVLFCALLLSTKDARKAEKYRVMLRAGMLDGVLLAPAAAVYVAYLYPERMLGQCYAMAGAAAYASQSIVWAYFFQVSRRESQAKLTEACVSA